MTHVGDGSSETYAFPASFAQERLWFFNQLVPDLAVYNLGCPYELSEVDPHPDPDTWLAAFAAVVQRHESLRTHLEMRDGELMQIVHAQVQPTVTRTDLRDLGESEAMVRAEEIASADAAAPIPLDQAPLWRARLIRRAADDWMFILVVHHAVFDAQSVPNLTIELYETYRAMRARRAPHLPDLPIQYADFAVWQRSRMADGGLDDQLDYWKTKLAELPDPLRLPVIGADRDRDSGRNRGGVTAFTLPPEIATRVAEIARAEVTTPFVVLLSAFSALLSRMTGQTDMIIGSPVSGRVTPELQSLVGMFVNTLMVRVDCSAGPSFRDLVRQVRGTVLDALDNQEIPYDRLVELLAADRVADGSPLHQVVFNMLPISHNSQIRNGTAKVDLLIDLADTENGYDGQMEYRGDLMDAAAAATFTDRLRRLLTAALADPDISIDRLSILDEAERRHILDGAASTTRRPADPTFVIDLFEAQVDARPSGLAVADTTGRRLTYQDLDEQANQLARQLADTVAVGADTTVAILLETGVQLAVTVLAVLKAGAAYLPLDQQHPAERMRYLINDARAVAVLTDASSLSRLPALDVPVIDVDAQAEAIAAQPTGRPARTTPPDALAYVIYTSGSTGEPKGVAVTRGNLASYADELGPLLDAQPGHVFSMLQPLTFDFSVTMFYGALVSGGVLHLVSRDFATDSHWVAEHLRRDQVDYMKITPSHLRALQAGADLGSLLPRRMLLLGGEASDMAWVRSLRTARPGSTVVNHYGPTETTVGAVALPADRDPYPDAVITPLGWPLAHARAYVLDQRAEPVPDGVIGELYLGGATVARGYLHRPSLTAARFLPDPFAGRPGARFYRTGDRARRRPDGSIEFLGRVDDQVKVHGYRVEPDEVRHVLREHPAVADCAVVPYGDGVKTDVQLIGYVVVAPDTGFDPADLHAYMAERLPEFMVPSAFVALDALPLAAHGKVDRSRLPAPVVEAAPLADPPVGATEDLVAALFSLLLGRDGIGRQDNFFGLGGHSLLAIQLVTRLRASFGIGMPLRAVFEDPTVTGVARQVEIQLRKRSRQLPPVEPLKAGDPLVASLGQRRLWFLDQLEGSEPLYNTNIRHRVTGPLDVPLLERAFVEVVRRHEVLRSRFISTDGELFQQVLDEPSVPFRVVDFSAHPTGTRTAAVEQALEEHAGQAIDLATEPPLRVLVATVTSEEHVLLITAHHVVNDAWSAGLMMRELGELYAAFRDRQPSPLAPLPVQYADFAAWQRKLLAGPLRDTQLRYWRQQLAGAPQRLELPTDRPRPLRRGYAGDHVLFDVPDSVVARLRAIGADGNASLFMVLLAAFKVLLARYCGQSDVVVGTPSSNRPRPELEPLIGFFLNTLALRTDCSGDPTFADLLARVRNTTLDAFANSDVPFEALVDDLAIGRDLGGTPLVQVLFTLEDAERTATTAGDVEFSWQPFGTPTAKFDVTLYLWRRAAGLSGAVEFRTDLFDRTTMQRFAEHFRAVLSGAAYDPSQRISELFVPSTDDICRVDGWNATAVSYAGGVTLAGGVAAAVAGSPDAPALCFRDEWFSYREFGERVNRLARRLCVAGVGVGDVVGVCLDRGADLVVAVHAVVAAGAAYLPLEPDYPDDRLTFMVADAGVRLVITDRETRFPGVSTMAAAGEPDGLDGSALEVSIPPDALAYVIYTSGSTGRPKGVGVSHRAIVNRLSWMQEAFPLTGSDRVLHKTPFSFDVSVWELFWPLLVGAGLVVADAGGQRDPAYLGRLIESQGVSTVHFVPSMLDVFLDQPDVAVRCASLRRVMASGEALSPGLVARWYRVLPGVGLHNLYGPTEAAVDVSWHATLPGESRTPIGRPIANTRIEIVDADGQRVPIGTVGELCIGGVQLARGYLHRPSLTAERFVPDAFGAPGARLYRSGDLARWLPDGEVEYLGRIDHQVKVRGFRIELGEIEAALVDAPQVRSAVVTTYQDGSGSRLVGYVVPDADNGTDPDLTKTLQARLRERLPEHMVPASLVTLAELPLTANGKLDRAALPAPQPVTDRPFTPPRSTAEQHIAQIWSDVLGVTQVSADDDFFALGGDSIRSLKVIARLRTNGYTLKLEDIFLQPKLDGLANHLVRDESGAAEPARTEPYALLDPAAADTVRELVPAADAYPLAALQAGMLFHSEYEPSSAVYHDVFTLWLTTPYDRESLADSLAAVAAIHPVLRTSVHLALLDDPVQIVHRDATIPLVEADIGDLPPEAANAWVEAFVESEKRHPFDLTTPPLLRVFAHRRSDGFALTLSFHHAILDGWSVATLTTELLSRYAARLDGRTLPVEPLPIAYSEFVAAERGILDSAESAEFWRSTLADAPVSRIPDLVEPAGDDTDLAILSAALPATLLDDLGRVARDLQVPIRSVLLAAHLRVLGLFAGQTDVVTGLVTHGRPEHEAGGRVLGLFLNSIPIRVSLTAPTWSALIQSTFAAEAAAMPHRRFPLMEIQRQCGQGTLFEVLFDFRDFHVYGDLPADGGVAVNGYQFFEQTNLPLAVNIIRSPADGTVSVQLKYARTRYSPAQVDAVRDAYLRILEAIAADPGADPRPTARYLLDDICRVDGWNATAVSYAGGVTLAGGVAAAVAGSPDAPALCFRDEWVSYREFGERVNGLARRVCAAGVGVGDVVGVCLDRGADLVVAVHAVVAAGAAYLPLEPDYPDDRLTFMVADAGVRLVITDRETRFPGVSTMAAAGEPDGLDGSALEVSIPPDALAYVIYTSGSTGRPKGVGVSHRAIVNRLSWMQEAFPLTGSDRVLHKTPFSFDVSVWELFWPLLVGAGLVVADAGGQRDPAYLGRLIESQGVSTVHFVPSMLDVFLDQPDVAVRCASLRRVMASGEALSPGLVARWYRVLPGVGLHNLYGPTEAAVDVSWHATLPGESRTPIGRPIANTRIEIVDADGQRVPIGTVGELCIGGVQLARGYLHRPSLTAERFVPDAFGAPGARLYRSGDLARWLPDGEVEYLGRIDHQVKVRGFRIELGEIEAALVDAPQVRSAVVTTYQDGSGSRLVGYVVPDADNGTDPDLTKTLQARLRERLPEHMVPASLVTLAELPLTANGKLDRAALPAPQPVTDRPFTPPRSTAEQHIAQIWSDVLGVTQVSADDDFFALGGDSIRSLKVIARLRTNGYTVALQQIFQHPKVRELAAELDAPPPAATSAAPEPSTAFGLVNPADLALLSQVITGTAGKERS